MTAFRLTLDLDGNLELTEDLCGERSHESIGNGDGWCAAEDAAEWIEVLLSPMSNRGHTA